MEILTIHQLFIVAALLLPVEPPSCDFIDMGPISPHHRAVLVACYEV